jgi:phosphohistidine phosphatase
MMKELYILRHGIAVEPGTPGLPDDERPLTPRGEKRMREIGRGLRRLDLKLDRIVTSPLPRARSTAEIVADALDADDLLETDDILRAGTDAATIQRWLTGRSEDRLLIVGHNPALSDLITLLVLGLSHAGSPVCELKKGGIAGLEPSSSSDRYELRWLATPGLIRRLSTDGKD